ncbi:hypothetical protein MTO96_006947 [Rhipicephalus appendiculatus]
MRLLFNDRCFFPVAVDSTPTGRTGVSGPASTLPASGGCRRRLSGRRAPAAARLLRRSPLVEDDVVLVAGSDEDELFLPLSKGLRVMRDVSSVTALKGKSVSLVCPLYVAAWASVSWEKGSNKIPFNHRQRVQPDGSLSISNVQQVSDDGNYVCRFTDSRNQKHTGNVLLKVIEPPVISHYEFRKDMQVGMRIKVFCTVVQGDPPFLFTWLKDGVPVVENEPPKWDVEPESAAVVQGRNVQLQCSASGTPQPIITWMIASDSTREEFLPLYNSHKYGLFPNGTLSIHQLEPEESGYYLCKASNGFGEDLSKLVFLTVKLQALNEASWQPLVFKAESVQLSELIRRSPRVTRSRRREAFLQPSSGLNPLVPNTPRGSGYSIAWAILSENTPRLLSGKTRLGSKLTEVRPSCSPRHAEPGGGRSRFEIRKSRLQLDEPAHRFDLTPDHEWAEPLHSRFRPANVASVSPAAGAPATLPIRRAFQKGGRGCHASVFQLIRTDLMAAAKRETLNSFECE